MSREQERARRLAQLSQRPLRPAITYSHRCGKRIPLNGKHFLRPDPYDIPVHEDDSPPVASRHVRIGKIYSAREPDPDDSPLSEDELEAVYGRDATPLSSPPRRLPPSSRTSDEDHNTLFVSDVPARHGLTTPKTSLSTRPGCQSSERNSPTVSSDIIVQAADRKRRTIPQCTPATSHVEISEKGIAKPTQRTRSTFLPLSSSSRPVSRAGLERPAQRTPAPLQVTRSAASRSTKPRLPVNELLLVRSPTETDVTRDPLSDFPGPETQDPITCSAVRQISGDLNPSNQAPSPIKAPLTSIRKRIKAPKIAHKSVVALRNKQRARAPFFRVSKDTRTSGDGFESAELKVTHPASVMKQRRARKPLTSGFSALTLRAGPLPNVDFVASGVEREQEKSHDGDVSMADDEGTPSAESSIEDLRPRNQPRRQPANLRDCVLDEAVALRLSSVTAPRRVYSISSDDGEESDEEDSHWLESEIERYGGVKAVRCVDHNEVITGDTDGDQSTTSRTLQPEASRAGIPSGPSRNTGVTLDFRRSTTPGAAINRHLIEVDEMIDDAPHPEDLSACTSDRDVRHQSIVHVTRFPDQETPVRQNRPRSILRRKTSAVQEADTSPEHTAANTRRNSMRATEESHYFRDEDNETSPDSVQPRCIRRNTEITLDDQGHYFSNATSELRNQTHPKPRIIKQRSSEARRASYYSQPDVLVPDSNATVPETSTALRGPLSEPFDYTNMKQLDILKRHGEVTWASSLPRVPRDLKTLTRTVSREHGTLSHAARRRPSLPFTSPVKVR